MLDQINTKYCCGCGLCNNVKKGNIDEKGFFRPSNEINDKKFDSSVCYSNYLQRADLSSLWGNIDSLYYGYSKNENIRKKASSGGVLTEIACYLLDNKIVDYIVQIKASSTNQLTTEVVFNTKSSEVINSLGSRYTASASLINILNMFDSSKKYAIIGKPCDIRVLREYMKKNPQYNESILYLLTFFCAGTPSQNANLNLINYMNVNPNEIAEFTYRGNGWPGKTTALKKDGKEVSTDYEISWGKYLGRDLQNICRFCWEGVGEAADISCGDGWYIENDKPIFKENAGRNIVLCRNSKGTELLENMKKNQKIELEEIQDVNILENMQPNHFIRKSSMFSSVLAMRLMFKEVPKYRLRVLYKYSKNITFKDNLKIFLGTVKRIIKGKIK